MCHSKLHQSWTSLTRRAIADRFLAENDERRRHPIAGRTPGKFPLAMTIGLMTVGVIAAISTLQLLTAAIG